MDLITIMRFTYFQSHQIIDKLLLLLYLPIQNKFKRRRSQPCFQRDYNFNEFIVLFPILQLFVAFVHFGSALQHQCTEQLGRFLCFNFDRCLCQMQVWARLQHRHIFISIPTTNDNAHLFSQFLNHSSIVWHIKQQKLRYIEPK